MKRRNFVIGAGALASGAAAVGTGAFSTVEAEREAVVSIENDADAYLGLEPIDEDRVEEVDGTIQVLVDLNQVVVDGDNLGSGVGQDSEYRFDRTFEARNQGTNTVGIFAEFPDVPIGPIEDFFFYDSDDDDRAPLTESDAESLTPGDSVDVGVGIEIGNDPDIEDPDDSDDYAFDAILTADEDAA